MQECNMNAIYGCMVELRLSHSLSYTLVKLMLLDRSHGGVTDHILYHNLKISTTAPPNLWPRTHDISISSTLYLIHDQEFFKSVLFIFQKYGSTIHNIPSLLI